MSLVTPLPDTPKVTDGKLFPRVADAFDAALQVFSTQIGGLSDTTVTALAGSNFKGLWSTLAGALPMPASVYSSGVFWKLLRDVANVTAEIPGTSTAWAAMSGYVRRPIFDSFSATRTPFSNMENIEVAVVDTGLPAVSGITCYVTAPNVMFAYAGALAQTTIAGRYSSDYGLTWANSQVGTVPLGNYLMASADSGVNCGTGVFYSSNAGTGNTQASITLPTSTSLTAESLPAQVQYFTANVQYYTLVPRGGSSTSVYVVQYTNNNVSSLNVGTLTLPSPIKVGTPIILNKSGLADQYDTTCKYWYTDGTLGYTIQRLALVGNLNVSGVTYGPYTPLSWTPTILPCVPNNVIKGFNGKITIHSGIAGTLQYTSSDMGLTWAASVSVVDTACLEIYGVPTTISSVAGQCKTYHNNTPVKRASGATLLVSRPSAYSSTIAVSPTGNAGFVGRLDTSALITAPTAIFTN